MANVLSKPEYKAAKGYQGFPLRNSIHFSSALGHLLPVWWHTLDPGDKVDISCILRTRTNPLDAPALVSINEHLDWFFVPYKNIFKLFEQVFYGVDDIHSSIFDAPEEMSGGYPCTYLSSIVRLLITNNEQLDYFGYNYNAGVVRLLQALGYDISSALDWNLPAINNFSILEVARSLWSLCAYQAIYYSHYRLSDRESNNPRAYNLDYYYNEHVPLAYNQLSRNMFMLRYRPIQKDFFHGGFVSPLIGSGNIGMLSSFNSGSYGFSSSFFRNYLGTSQQVQSVDSSLTSTSTSPTDIIGRSGSSGFNVNQSLSGLRQSFALEKLLEITRRAGKHIDEQTLAHFGVKMPEGISDEPYFIGSNDSEIQIGDVISTAGTDSDPLGELAGKGYNHSNGHIGKFEAKCHGILMCIYSSDIPLHYRSDMCDRLNTMVSPSDFYHPEFDDLGMQPIFQYQGKSDYDQLAPTENNTIKDWTYRYWEQKIKYNRVFGSLESTPDNFDNLSNWTVSRYGFEYTGGNTISNYLVNPNFTDSIALQKFYSQIYFKPVEGQGGDVESYVYTSGPTGPDANWRTLIFGSDLFIHDLFVDVKVASKKSVYGLPSL